jgi:dolichol-phosphate mannosyltransferase
LVILPTFNERETVEAVITGVLQAAPQVEILVVDDASPDGTGTIVRSISDREPRVRLIERPVKGGLASAYATGFRRALEEGFELVVEMDADLSHQPDELPRLLQGAEHHDLTVGSRYIPGGAVTNWGLLRRALSRGGNSYASAMLRIGVADSTSGFRVFRRPVLRFLLQYAIQSEGYGFQIELVYRAWNGGYAVGEVPITFREREHGHSKISRRIVFEALWLVTVWGLRDRLRSRRSNRAGPDSPPDARATEPSGLSRDAEVPGTGPARRT